MAFGVGSCPPVTAPWLQAGNTVTATITPESGSQERLLVTGENRQCYYGWPTTPCFGAAQNRVAKQCGWPQKTVVVPQGTRNPMYPFRPKSNSYLDAVRAPSVLAFSADPQVACVDWVAPTGARSVQIAPNTWSILPNNVPPAVAINAYHLDDYIADIYDNNRKVPFGCACARRK